MHRDSMQQLRLDRRLIRRRGWISAEELARELAALPDAASKATTLGETTQGGSTGDSPSEKPTDD
jgi:hypothetical protein